MIDDYEDEILHYEQLEKAYNVVFKVNKKLKNELIYKLLKMFELAIECKTEIDFSF
jgi:hypothetical protein